MREEHCKAMGFSYPMFFMSSKRFLFGSKVLTNPIDNLIQPFPFIVWMLVLSSLLAFIALFVLIHTVYSNVPNTEGLMLKSTTKIDVIIKTIGTLTEPDKFPYFPKLSTGFMKIIYFQNIFLLSFSCSLGLACTVLWGIAVTFFSFFYNSNLRAHLMNVQYSPRIDTLEDAKNHVKKMFYFGEEYVSVNHHLKYAIEHLGEDWEGEVRLFRDYC